jgi:CubicO group peptidase (beta-lactamase class C family)
MDAPDMNRILMVSGPTALLLSSLLTGGCATSPESDPPVEPPIQTAAWTTTHETSIDSVRSLLLPLAAEGVGISLAVYRGGEPVWIEGMGYADLAARRPVAPATTRFRVYSLSKPMTAVAGGRQMESGVLDPAVPIQRYLPSFPEKDRPVTAMALATHRAGIRHYVEGEAQNQHHCANIADALSLFADDPLLPSEGPAEVYSSWGFVLLSAVIEAAGGVSFSELMGNLVLRPVGMADTALDDGTPGPDHAAVYAEADGRAAPAEPVDNSCKWGAGAYLSTAPDMARFGIAMFDGMLLAPPSQQLFLRGAESYRAQGVGAGGTAFLLTHPGSATSIVLLSNVSGESWGPRLQAAFEVMGELFVP